MIKRLCAATTLMMLLTMSSGCVYRYYAITPAQEHGEYYVTAENASWGVPMILRCKVGEDGRLYELDRFVIEAESGEKPAAPAKKARPSDWDEG